RVRAGLQLELVESIHAREDHHRLEPGLVVVDAVEHVVVVARALAVGGERGRSAPGQAARPVDVGARVTAHDAGDGTGEVHEVAPVEGEALDRLALDRKSTRLNSSHDQISYAV